MNRPFKKRDDGRILPGWPMMVAVLVASASAVIYLDDPAPDAWNCAPLSTEGSTNDRPVCFHASVSHQNQVTLHWKLREYGDSVYIYSDRPPGYHDPGLQAKDCERDVNGFCAAELSLEQGGFYRWILAVSNEQGQKFHASVEVKLPPSAPPMITSGGGFVDLLNPSPQSFSWTPADDAAPDNPPGWVEIRKHGEIGWPEERHPLSGPEARLEIPADEFETPGEEVYAVRACHIPLGGLGKFCSPSVDVAYKVGYDHFYGYRNRHLAAGEDAEISFSNRSGNMRLLSSTSLIPEGMAVASGSSYIIEGSLLTPGVHTLELNSCVLPIGPCSNRVNAAPAPAAGALWQNPPGSYSRGETIATFYPQDGGDPRLIPAPASGKIGFVRPGPIHMVAAGETFAYSLTQPGDILKLVVGSPVKWQLSRPYTEDFEPGTAVSSLGFGQALDITFDPAGGVWMLNEFSNGVEYLRPDGEMQTLAFPLARQRLSQLAPGSAYPATRPFYLPWGEGGTRASISTLGERVALFDGRLWFTQGGSHLLSPAFSDQTNRSRIISFDPHLENSAETPDDDRFCVYNIPTNDQHGLGNNAVIGLTSARGRIWFAESRGLINHETSYLSSFVPDPASCQNLLDFDDPQAVIGQSLLYCAQGQSPEQDRCVASIPMPVMERPLKIAHLKTAPTTGKIWFTDASGQYLGSYDPLGEGSIELKEIGETHRWEHDTVADLGGFPWSLEVTDTAVYVGEYAARHILRYDIATDSFSEVRVPYNGRNVRLHSLALDHLRQRLWFTLANECSAPGSQAQSTLGYVDLDSWEQYLQDRRSQIDATLYSGLESIPDCEMNPQKHQSFRGIAIDPQSGKIALATSLREQITLLSPLPGFWP